MTLENNVSQDFSIQIIISYMKDALNDISENLIQSENNKALTKTHEALDFLKKALANKAGEASQGLEVKSVKELDYFEYDPSN